MERDFWLNKWQSGEIGFHQNKVMPLLQKYWPELETNAPAKVLVPLAGKTLDILWFAEQNYEVYAIELSEIAIQQFFDEHGLSPETEKNDQFTVYKSGNINFICGDIFTLKPGFFHQFQACYDRAALIALPDDMRNSYVKHVYNNLPTACKTLLLTIDYKQSEMQGPPFAVGDQAIDEMFADTYAIKTLDHRDILANEPKFKERGLTSMFTNVYLLNKN